MENLIGRRTDSNTKKLYVENVFAEKVHVETESHHVKLALAATIYYKHYYYCCSTIILHTLLDVNRIFNISASADIIKGPIFI